MADAEMHPAESLSSITTTHEEEDEAGEGGGGEEGEGEGEEGEGEEGEGDEDGDEDNAMHSPGSGTTAIEPSLSHLREISPLASWTVSTYKPGCGVAALLSASPTHFWQSDGPQPHLLNVHFFKLVSVVRLRVYLDFELDESYTPTRLVFAGGTGEYDLVEFAEWKWTAAAAAAAGENVEGPRGWVDIGLEGVGGGEGEEGGGVLRCMCLQMRVMENHQNGKDTHIRGVQIFARDERAGRKAPVAAAGTRTVDGGGVERLGEGLEEADWMGEPELR